MPKKSDFSPLQQGIIRLHVSGMERKEIARTLECHVAHVSNTIFRYRRADADSDHQRIIRMEEALQEILLLVRQIVKVPSDIISQRLREIDREFRVRQAERGLASSQKDRSLET